jgi:hypothetical protein
MTRCTVCGAESREGAKFCTSCGTPLVDETTEQEEGTSGASSAERVDGPESTATTQNVDPEPDSTSSATSARDDNDSDSAASATGNGHFTSSWPDADTGDEEASGDTDDDQEAHTSTASREESPWPGAWNNDDDHTEDDDDRIVTSAAPDSFATDAWQDRSASDTTSRDASAWPGVSAADNDVDDDDSEDDRNRVFPSAAPTSFATDTDQDNRTPAISEDRGASDWEGWAPTASGPSTTSVAFDEHLDHARKLVDELQHRLERLGPPASLASRNLNPDDLADQMERWSRALPNSDELFEVVQQVRRSPRDIDAMVRLADHAADLELLVRHYQSITSTSDQWATDLRRNREESSNS